MLFIFEDITLGSNSKLWFLYSSNKTSDVFKLERYTMVIMMIYHSEYIFAFTIK